MLSSSLGISSLSELISFSSASSVAFTVSTSIILASCLLFSCRAFCSAYSLSSSSFNWRYNENELFNMSKFKFKLKTKHFLSLNFNLPLSCFRTDPSSPWQGKQASLAGLLSSFTRRLCRPAALRPPRSLHPWIVHHFLAPSLNIAHFRFSSALLSLFPRPSYWPA